FDADLEFMGFYDFPKSSLVVVSSPKKLVAEWRFVIVNQQVVSGCEYKRNNSFNPQPGYDADAFDLANVVASAGNQPDPVWIVDICQNDRGEYALLEIGGFSFSDLYCCDKAVIANAVSDVAVDLWTKAHS